MIILAISIIFFIASFVTYRLSLNHNSKYSVGDYEHDSSYIGLMVFGIVSLVLLVIIQSITHTHQVYDLEELNLINKEISIHEERAEDISSELKEILVTQYADHEQKIFESMSGEGISLYLVKYPELNSHKTFMKMSDKLIELNDKAYNKRIRKLRLERTINSRRRYIYTLGFLMP